MFRAKNFVKSSIAPRKKVASKGGEKGLGSERRQTAQREAGVSLVRCYQIVHFESMGIISQPNSWDLGEVVSLRLPLLFFL